MNSFGTVDTLDVILTDRITPLRIGRLLRQNNEILFEYDATFTASGIELSPFALPLGTGIRKESTRIFNGLFGVFDDSLPDGWGRRLMDREFARMGIEPARVSPLDRLHFIGDRGLGALSYRPAADMDAAPSQVDFDDLVEHSQRIDEGSPEAVLPQLVVAGGSPAGARPKVMIWYNPDTDRMLTGGDAPPGDFVGYLVKFPTRDDGKDIGGVEMAYADMARQAGIDIPDTKLFMTGTDLACFGIQRFDRAGNERRHIHTLGGLLNASHREFGCTYSDYLRATTLLTRNRSATLQAFRRMVFNVLAHNRDDHVKNFSFLMDPSGEWNLSPAYDLIFSDGPNGEHSMMVGREGRNPTYSNFMEVADRENIDEGTCKTIVEEVRESLSEWVTFATKYKVEKQRIDYIRDKLMEVDVK